MDLRIVYLFNDNGEHVGSAVKNQDAYVSLTITDPDYIDFVISEALLTVKDH